MQLTDKVLLPATISYTGHQSTSARLDDAAQSAGVRDTDPTAEAGHSEVHNVAVSAKIEDDTGCDEIKITDVRSVTVDNTAHPFTTSNCVEFNKQYSTSHRAGQSPADTATSVSIMTVSLVNFPSDCICDTVEVDSASSSTVLQSLATAVHVDGTFLHSADTNIISTDSTVAGDDYYAGQSESTSLISSAVLEHDGCSEVQKHAEWTRYFVVIS